MYWYYSKDPESNKLNYIHIFDAIENLNKRDISQRYMITKSHFQYGKKNQHFTLPGKYLFSCIEINENEIKYNLIMFIFEDKLDLSNNLEILKNDL